MTETQVSDWMDSTLETAASTSTDSRRKHIIVVQETHEVNLRWASNALTTNGAMGDRTATVIAFAPVASDPDGDSGGTDSDSGWASASVTGPCTRPADLTALVARADIAVADADADTDAAPLITAQDSPTGDTELFEAPAETVGPEDFAALAAGLGLAFDRAREAGHLLFGFAEYRRTTSWVASSTGLRRRTVEPMGRLEVNAKDPDLINSAWVGASTNDFTDVDVGALHQELTRRLDWGRRRVDLEPGTYETILPAGAVVDLMVYAYWSMSARDAVDGRSVFSGPQVGSTRIGERLTELPFTMTSDPAHPEVGVAPFAVVPSTAPGLTSVFDNGAQLEPVHWICCGRLADLVRPRAAMQRDGIDGPPRFPISNLVIDAGGEGNLDDLIAGTERGLLLTCLWYIREVDPQTLLLTGLTRDGVYLIEDGEVTAAVNNFRFNESPISLLQRATEASAAERVLCREWNDWFTRSAAPALRIPDFTMSTVSQAH